MKFLILYSLAALMIWTSCTKSKPGSQASLKWDSTIVAYAPVAVQKSSSKKIFAHFMPWFETPATSTNNTWGQHWKMTNQNPPASIASHYYPLNTIYFLNGSYTPAPYGTSDTMLIDYQLLLMKLSGIDGIFIDWPGTLNYADFAKNLSNTNTVVSRLARVGLKYAIVYEDQNLKYVSPSNKDGQIAQAQADMQYIQVNYFKDAAYETFNGKPILLDFGPFGPVQSAADWNTIFSVMSTPPAFFPYEGSSGKGGNNAVGEFAWVQQSDTVNLHNFYNNNYTGQKISGAYPGFNTFYAQGGVSGPTWTIPYTNGSLTKFSQTLSLALLQPGTYTQLITWNDYGEGTVIEPTTQYGYSYLTELQNQLGVQSLSESDLQAVAKLYTARKNNILPTYSQDKLNELDQVFYYMVALKMDSAKGLLANF